MLCPAAVTWPGPDGAEPQVSYEAIREGIQEAQAAIYVSEAVEKRQARLGGSMVGECETLLRDRYEYASRGPRTKYMWTYYTPNHYGWQALSQRTYGAAAAIAEKLGDTR